MTATTASASLPELNVQLVVPVYNEGENAQQLYDQLTADAVPFTSLSFVYDLDTDTTLPVVQRIAVADNRVQARQNQFGRGVVRALAWAFSQAEDGPVIVLMGDNSDKLSIIPDMIALWRSGATVVSPSRYMKGGKQHGGGFVKSGLSRAAGLSLGLLGFPTVDPTNNFKLYDGAWLREQTIESVGGFEIALELCCKAYQQKKVICELPTEWFDREVGESNFRLWKWLPHYLRWYVRCIAVIAIRTIRG